MWYLNPRMCALSFFDPDVPDQMKRKMIVSLNNSPYSEDNENKFIFHDIKEIVGKDISDFVNSDTLKFFTKFGLPTNFLQKDPSTWCNDDEYKSISKKVCKLKSVNDVAERGVKLIEEYNGRLTKDPAQQQNILKLVADYRKNFPKCTKETLCQPLL